MNLTIIYATPDEKKKREKETIFDCRNEMYTANSKGLSTKPNHSEINSSKYWGRSGKKIRVTTKTKYY